MVTTVSSNPTPTIHPTPPTLTEDEIDDLLYFSRTAELSDLSSTITSLSSTHNRYALEIIGATIDPYSGNTCLHMAAANGHADIVEYILGLEAPPDSTPTAEPQQEFPETQQAISTTTTPSSKYLTTLANLPNTYSRNTPLHWACLNGHLGVVKLLMEKGAADPGILNEAGHDCVYEAEVNDKSEVVEWVLKYAEGLEGVVGVLGEDVKDGEEEEREEVTDNAEVMRDEGSKHAEKVEKKNEGDKGGTVADRCAITSGIGELELEDREGTIR